MRKFLLKLAAGAMMVSSSAFLSAPATAAPATGNVEFCKSVTGPNPQPSGEGSLGDCLSLFQLFDLDRNGLPTQVCRFWTESGQLQDFGYDTFKECVLGEQGSF